MVPAEQRTVAARKGNRSQWFNPWGQAVGVNELFGVGSSCRYPMPLKTFQTCRRIYEEGEEDLLQAVLSLRLSLEDAEAVVVAQAAGLPARARLEAVGTFQPEVSR